MKEFWGYHSEWNMGSPGGWDYQRMAQELGKFAWQRIKESSKIDIQLDFENPILNPVPQFAKLLLRTQKREKPFIVLVTEEETLEKVGENIRFVKYLNSLEGVKSRLTSPQKLEMEGKEVFFEGNKVTCIFLDFNNSVIAKLKKKYNLMPLICAIKKGIVLNPRGMEPVGAKGVFEVITGKYKKLMNEKTIKRTPWTRKFYPRKTQGPKREEIKDLVEWVRKNWEKIVLKPIHGYSGKGIFIGYQRKNRDEDIKNALKSKNYIVQPLIPLDLWAEEYPWIDKEKQKIFIKKWQTDFRCFVTDIGLIGFVTRFGGVPTNVGSGGGVQPTAILKSDVSVRIAIDKINEAAIKIGYREISKLQEEITEKSIKMGNVYLLGPIMTTLRPRIITYEHLSQLKSYARALWTDGVKLEELWRKGRLEEFVEMAEEEQEIARMCPWKGSPGIMASDGLFNFMGGL